jgi:glutamine amidotransferase
VGQTDSEAAFCLLLEELRAQFPDGKPPLGDLHRALAERTHRLAELGSFNYLLSNGEHLFAHAATRLHFIVRRAPFGAAHLVDEDLTVDFAEHTGPDDRVAVIATAPLTDNEAWTELPKGEVVVFEGGALLEPER